MLEDLIGVEENNLPLPNAGEWELKTKRKDSGTLTTLLHMEPSPRVIRFVPKILLPKYGWPHKSAGTDYGSGEMSFRQTISAKVRTDRGFGLNINRTSRKIEVSFDSKLISSKHASWKADVERRVGLSELNPQPYWGFDDLYHRVATKMINCFYLIVDTKLIGNDEFLKYSEIMILSGFNEELFITAIEKGYIYVDFDARSGHNHGTKFRFVSEYLPSLYRSVIRIE